MSKRQTYRFRKAAKSARLVATGCISACVLPAAAQALAIPDPDNRREVMKKIEEIIQSSGIILQPYWRKLYNHSVEAVKNHGMHQTFEIDLEKVWLDEG